MKYKKAFTLIEMLVALGAFSLILPAVFGVFIGILQEQVKFIALKHIKTEGENALYSIKNTIKTRAVKTCQKTTSGSGYDCTKSCNDGDNQDFFYFQDSEGNLFRFFLDGNKIASESVNIKNNSKIMYYLTSDYVKIVDSNILTCSYLDSSTLIDINLDIQFKKEIGGITPSMKYNTKVLLISR